MFGKGYYMKRNRSKKKIPSFLGQTEGEHIFYLSYWCYQKETSAKDGEDSLINIEYGPQPGSSHDHAPLSWKKGGLPSRKRAMGTVGREMDVGKEVLLKEGPGQIGQREKTKVDWPQPST